MNIEADTTVEQMLEDGKIHGSKDRQLILSSDKRFGLEGSVIRCTKYNALRYSYGITENDANVEHVYATKDWIKYMKRMQLA